MKMGVKVVFFLCFAITCFGINGAQMIEEETRALLQTKWWNFHDCSGYLCYGGYWHSCEIICNDVGSVISITSYKLISNQKPQLADLNFTAFPNLQELVLVRAGLIG
ncbi:hypothetical protein K1719_035588 [Acacia pycnantha]|nr:hypothetical protein K1719_035588 [Acacia pycnantha]